jgi:mono/diheme cytochrome c family protein
MADQPHNLPPQDKPGLQVTESQPAPHHEHADPTDGYEPVPLWLITFFGALLFWGGWYLSRYAGDWRSDVLEESPGALREAAGPAAREDPMVLGKRLFVGNCASCHQATGVGVAGQYPPLASSDWVKGNPARLKRIVLHGLEGEITVNGTIYNNAMTPFGQKLSDKQIAAILTYIRVNPEWGNDAGPVAEESVAATREATRSRTTPWTAAELLALDEDEGPSAAATAPASATQPAVPPRS